VTAGIAYLLRVQKQNAALQHFSKVFLLSLSRLVRKLKTNQGCIAGIC
jgi:hypothetical protein